MSHIPDESDSDNLALLRLIQLSDSALPIGSASHSFGLESLIADGMLTVDGLYTYLIQYVRNVGRFEAVCCFAGYSLGAAEAVAFDGRWIALNQHISAVRTGRESRAASLALGRRFLHLAIDALSTTPAANRTQDTYPLLNRAAAMEKAIGGAHQSASFGLVAATLCIQPELACAAYLQQSLTCLVSACQRLMPVGQSQAVALLWAIKPDLLQAAVSGINTPMKEATLFMPTLDIASMRHPTLTTRLFIS